MSRTQPRQVMHPSREEEQILFTLKGTQWRNCNFIHSALVELQRRADDGFRQILKRSTEYAQSETPKGVVAVVTAEHVRKAWESLHNFGCPSKGGGWRVFTQVAEYIAAAVTGLGAGYLAHPAGIIAFGFGLCAGTILVVTRLVGSQRTE